MDTEFMMNYKNLIYKISKKFYGTAEDDLIQAGYLGLIKAYNNYNSNCNTKFSSYAYNYIYGEMYEVATGENPIKLRKDLYKIYKNVIKTREILEQKFERNVSYRETLDFLHLDYNLFVDIINSIDRHLNIDDCEISTSNKDRIDNLILLKQSLQMISEKEKEILKRRYMYDKTQGEISRELNISQAQICRLEKSGKDKIKKFILS